jgi:Tfp pilus assembly protein PilF
MKKILPALVLAGATAFAAASGFAVLPAKAASQQHLDACTKSVGDVAIAACTRIIGDQKESTANRAKAFYGRGFSYNFKGDYDRAIADFSEVLRIAPNNPIAFSGRGKAHYMKGDFDRAISDYNEADDLLAFDGMYLDPEDYYYRGDAYAKKGDLDSAITDYTEAVRLKPQDALVYRSRGLAYRKKGDLGKAIADYTKAIRLDPENADIYYIRGLFFAQQNDKTNAAADFRKAAELGHAKAEETLRKLGSAAASGRMDENDEPVAKDILKGFYDAASDPVASAFYAPKNLSWIVDEYDSDTLLRIGLKYLTGDSVEQSMEKAAIVLGGLHSVTASSTYIDRKHKDIPRPRLSDDVVGALAHAARVTASAYAEKGRGAVNFHDPNMDANFVLSSGFLELAIRAGSQEALIMKGYMYRLTRQAEPNPSKKLTAAANEKVRFEKASVCTTENTSRKITPWSQAVCDKAAQELLTSASVYETLLARHLSKQEAERRLAEAEKWDWALIIVSGFAASVAAGIQSSNGTEPLSAMEQYEKERRFIEHQMESTWAHVGAAMFVD